MVLVSFPTLIHASPPAPFYTLHGIVRDQVGQTITAEGAEVVLLKGGVELSRTPVTPITSDQFDQSFVFNISIDLNRSGTTTYSDKVFVPSGLYSLVVSMNGNLLYPIEVSGSLKIGKPGEITQLDLTLGEDKDKDGLPDTWEGWQLYKAGYYPNASGGWDLTLIDRDSDFDGDGQSNLLEYIAGTFAGDSAEFSVLTIKEELPESMRFEFYGVTGKVYTIESTLDMKTWTRVPFAVGAPGIGNNAYQASNVGIVSVFTAPRSSASEFYRLSIR